MTQCDRVVIDVPATTANLGPGFDSFGFALDVWNRVTVERADKFSMLIEGEGADRLVGDENNLIVQMTRHALEALGSEMPPLHFHCQIAVRRCRGCQDGILVAALDSHSIRLMIDPTGSCTPLHPILASPVPRPLTQVPPTRGMGSSSAALVAGLAAGLALGGKDMSTPSTKKLLLQMAASQEGHADNVAPAIYGGFQARCPRSAQPTLAWTTCTPDDLGWRPRWLSTPTPNGLHSASTYLTGCSASFSFRTERWRPTRPELCSPKSSRMRTPSSTSLAPPCWSIASQLHSSTRCVMRWRYHMGGGGGWVVRWVLQ